MKTFPGMSLRKVVLIFIVAAIDFAHFSASEEVHFDRVSAIDQHSSRFASDDGNGRRWSRLRHPSNSTERKCQRFGYQHSFVGHEGDWERRERLRANDLKHSCESRSSNARGTYTSLGTCIFRFHNISNDIVQKNHMSSACSDSNVVMEGPVQAEEDIVEQEVVMWPDACVGDFARCCSVKRDEKIVMRQICTKRLELPAGTTHVSVDCTADKAEQKKQLKNGEIEDEEYHAFVASLAGMACVCICICLATVNRYAVQPYRKAIKRKRPDPPEMVGLVSQMRAG